MKKVDISDNDKQKAKLLLEKFKNFSSFSRNKVDAYRFTNIVGVKVCPYCNINYTYTVFNNKRKAVIRPDIDHFEPKSGKGAELELENLVPSCATCNRSLKGKQEVSIKDYLHPYKDDFDSIVAFHIDLKTLNIFDETSFSIVFVPNENAGMENVKRAENNINLFKLKERYQQHKDVVVDIFRKINFYNQCKQEEIMKILSLNNISVPLEPLLFSDRDCDINKTSLGKLKKDIIELYL